jgi:hypothetical protein
MYCIFCIISYSSTSSSAVPNLYNYGEVFFKNCNDCHMLIVIFLGSINSQNTRQRTTINSLTFQRGVTSAACHSENITSWNDEHCLSRCTLSLIRQYLENRWSKCNRAASCVLVNVLALLWCGRQFLEIISSLFSLFSKSELSFCNL